MAATTKIRWSDATWNALTGCTQISDGCTRCYALTLAERFRGSPAYPVGFDPMLRPHKLHEPSKWKTPRNIFVNSMSDVFHPAFIDALAPDGQRYIDVIFDEMLDLPRHIYQVLTKRPRRMRDYLVGTRGEPDRFVPAADLPTLLRPDGYLHRRGLTELPEYIWPGTTIESDLFTFRADVLRSIPAPIRMLSCEPLLGPLPSLDLTGIGWVICGGESGPGFRIMDLDWARDLRDACAKAGCSFYFKQSSGIRTEMGQTLDGERYEERPVLARERTLL